MNPPAKADDARTRRAAQALVLWQGLVLVGICVVTALSIWHLRRRANVIRDRLRPRQFPAESLSDIADACRPGDKSDHDDPK